MVPEQMGKRKRRYCLTVKSTMQSYRSRQNNELYFVLMTKNSNWRPVALTLTALGAIARLLPHPPNFAPVGSMSLVCRRAVCPCGRRPDSNRMMAITDPILGAFYGVPAYSRYQLFIYGSFLISVWAGRRLRGTESVPKIASFALLNSMQFFSCSAISEAGSGIRLIRTL